MIDTKTGEVKTVAGNGRSESKDGTGLDAGIWNPQKVVFYRSPTAKPDSVLYFTSANGGVRRFDIESGAVSTLTLKSTPIYPYGIECTPSGHLIVSCVGSHSIYVVDPTNDVVKVLAGSGASYRSGSADGAGGTAQFSWPIDLVVSDSERCVYVGDKHNNRIRRMNLPSRLFVPRERLATANVSPDMPTQSQPVAETVARALPSTTSDSNQQTPSESADRADAKSAVRGQSSKSTAVEMKEIQSDIQSMRDEVIRLCDGWKVITSGAAEGKIGAVGPNATYVEGMRFDWMLLR